MSTTVMWIDQLWGTEIHSITNEQDWWKIVAAIHQKTQ